LRSIFAHRQKNSSLHLYRAMSARRGGGGFVSPAVQTPSLGRAPPISSSLFGNRPSENCRFWPALGSVLKDRVHLASSPSDRRRAAPPLERRTGLRSGYHSPYPIGRGDKK